MGQIYQLKVTINHTSPSIWRRMHISSDCTFFDLHVAIQNAMGWTDSHLHSFSMIQRGTARAISIEYPNPEREPFQEPALDETKEKIAAYFGKQVKQCIYTYDFGDNWEHIREKLILDAEDAVVIAIICKNQNVAHAALENPRRFISMHQYFYK